MLDPVLNSRLGDVHGRGGNITALLHMEIRQRTDNDLTHPHGDVPVNGHMSHHPFPSAGSTPPTNLQPIGVEVHEVLGWCASSTLVAVVGHEGHGLAHVDLGACDVEPLLARVALRHAKGGGTQRHSPQHL